MDDKPLNDRQRRYVELLASGLDSVTAARQAGYGAAYAKKLSTRAKQRPVLSAAIDEVRQQVRKTTLYTAEVAMAEAEDAIAFAKKNKNAMAYCKALEIRARISGLWQEKLVVESFDLKEALEYAKSLVNWGPLPLPPVEIASVTDKPEDDEQADRKDESEQ